ncbi:CDP-alcohol phosphatidyltransferase family protein [Gemmatimonas aurantiaca]|nr:CDP-alcohol phosphatidyltransferase family protein [Gemmatimonas aurantiaca]
MTNILSDISDKVTPISTKIFTPANLLSLSRIPLAALTVYCLAQDKTFYAVALFVVAAITDFLDGFAARISEKRTGVRNKWGEILDPVSDKIFAIVTLVGILMYRELPLWMAGMIVIRDVGIVLAGSLLLRGRDVIVQSNLPGKYYFASLSVLLVSYLTMFDFGVLMLLPLTGLLWLWSTVSYVVTHKRLYVDNIVPKRPDNDGETTMTDRLSWLRTAITVTISLIYLYKFFVEQPYLNW